jgi:hypothetical protein
MFMVFSSFAIVMTFTVCYIITWIKSNCRDNPFSSTDRKYKLDTKVVSIKTLDQDEIRGSIQKAPEPEEE